MNTAAIIALRRRLGLTVAQFAAKLGVTERTVLRWEAGGSRPRNSYRLRLQWLATDYAPLTGSPDEPPQIIRLFQELLAAPDDLWGTMAVLADELEAAGAIRLAAAYRYTSAYKLWPVGNNHPRAVRQAFQQLSYGFGFHAVDANGVHRPASLTPANS